MNVTSETLTERYARQDSYGSHDPAWHEKMVHRVPNAPVVDRVLYCCRLLSGKTILSLGATGPMQDMVDQVAARVYATDIQGVQRDDFYRIDLDEHPQQLPDVTVDMVFAGETLEHLSNPGNVLKVLQKYCCPLLITVPNAFASSGYSSMVRGIETVNPDHVAWYSWWTLTNLLHRYDYKVAEFCWYNGQPRISEGLIVLTE